MELHIYIYIYIYTVGSEMFCTLCTTWTVRVKIIILERSCLEARVNDTSNFDFKSAEYYYEKLLY